MWRAKNWWWKLVVIAFALHLASFAAAIGYSIYRSWETLDGILAWPFLQVWSVLSWVWSLTIVSGPAGWLWNKLDLLLYGPMNGNPWWRTAVIGLAGVLIWRKRWLISVAGLLLILLPTLAVFASRAVAWLLELGLWIVSPLYPGELAPEAAAEGAPEPASGLPPRPKFGDPYRQGGGPI